MSFFRSERMFLYSIVFHQDTAFDCLVEMAYFGQTQLINVYDGYIKPNNKYSNEVQRCIELEETIQHLQEEINRLNMKTYYYPNVDIEEIPREKDFQELSLTIMSLEKELVEVTKRCDTLKGLKFSIYEHQQVLLKTQDFLTGARNTEVQITSYDSMLIDLIRDITTAREEPRPEDTAPLSFITGAIPVARSAAFEIMIWRISRGNAYVRFAEFEVPADLATVYGQSRYKKAFIIVFVGNKLQAKLNKICQGFQATIYPCPEIYKERKETFEILQNDKKDLDKIFEKSCEHKKRILSAATTEIYIWRSKIRKMHDVFFVLNRLGRGVKTTDKYLQADVWIPKHSADKLNIALLRGALRAAENNPLHLLPPIVNERTIPDRVKPPTFFRTNKFTRGFQQLIDAYGIASYREVNPAPYTIITFPFLFAIMFGDTGHGLLLLLFATMFILREETIERQQKESTKIDEIFDLLFAGRYVLLLMGIFSIYTGVIFNDFFSRAMNLFGSSWQVNFTKADVMEHKHLQLDPAREDNFRGVPYIFGIDPIWKEAENSIHVSNSYKMKMSIILGVFQMLFGLSLSAWNALYNSSKVDFYLVFIPTMIFFLALFFYLVFLIFFKWYVYGGHNILEHSPTCAPSILITFINMMLMKEPEEPLPDCKAYMFENQPAIQRALMLITVITVPILLCGKPLYFMLQQQRLAKIEDLDEKRVKSRKTLVAMRKSKLYAIEQVHIEVDDTEENLSEIWIHSGIHTIECVLGSVSHTASYLRLWALSLAHAQLSDVLWEMVLSVGLKKNLGFYGAIVVFISFAFFAILTVTILVVMEGLSAFLHTLRLHWVEFQSKFFVADGEAFKPFRFKPSSKMDTVTT